MKGSLEPAEGFSFADAERAQLKAWVHLIGGAKIDFFEEMVGSRVI